MKDFLGPTVQAFSAHSSLSLILGLWGGRTSEGWKCVAEVTYLVDNRKQKDRWLLETWYCSQKQRPVTCILQQPPPNSPPNGDQAYNTPACGDISESNFRIPCCTKSLRRGALQILIPLKKHLDGCFLKGDGEKKRWRSMKRVGG